MTQIDWSKAPEGATHAALTGGVDGHHVWYKIADRGFHFMYSDEVERGWLTGNGGPTHTPMQERPVAPAWDGTGLPPVGTVCEALNRLKEEWLKVKILDHEGTAPTAVCRDEKNRLWWAQDFRPIRTPEQIAAEERKAAIDRMTADAQLDFSAGEFLNVREYVECVIAALHDAGYRKQVAP